jgi:hypothetical protein
LLAAGRRALAEAHEDLADLHRLARMHVDLLDTPAER